MVHACNSIHKNMVVCPFREIDWLFSSDNGRRQLAESAGKIRRIKIMIVCSIRVFLQRITGKLLMPLLKNLFQCVHLILH